MRRRSGLVVLWSLAWYLAAGLALGAPARAAAQTGLVRCESQGGKRVQCPIAQNARATLSRHLSDTPCVENQNWGVGNGFLWVSNGCRAEFTVAQVALPPARPVPAQPVGVVAQQIRVCRAEADRRLANYSGDQIAVELSSREGPSSWFTWEAGSSSGRCQVAANGRLLQFSTNKPGYRPGYGGAGTTMLTCESMRTERKECPVPQGARVRLARQTSDNPCRLNDTYGEGPGYLWVAQGCRGQFEVTRGPSYGQNGPGSVTQLACAAPSNNVQQNCPIPEGARARYVSQQSAQPCIVNQTYGITASYVWVSRGCRATFEVSTGGYVRGGYPGAPTTRQLTCESSGAARQQCPVEGVTSVRLIRQISTSPCQLSRTFGAGFGHIWVSNGCRGEFEVTVSPAGGAGMHGANTGLPEHITCESDNGQRAECRYQRSGGQVSLVRQLSTTPCTRNSTWGTGSGNTIWVTRGCRAEFEVR
jgi:DUF3011 family protein